ncbi:hypothetical protein AB4302_02285 [Vibrio breoganii]|uniref:hypothetical protein n=1 Tax=Vibrio breoganii TaxID=553239 RepID=UPI0021C444B6|nr:hypothetical protein [Vibrio breoganii]MDN3717477.1 hypothetical protein [Vibrio breoganii]
MFLRESTRKFIIDFFVDEEGLTVVEYVVGAAALVVAISAVFVEFGNGLQESMSATMNSLPTVNN